MTKVPYFALPRSSMLLSETLYRLEKEIENMTIIVTLPLPSLTFFVTKELSSFSLFIASSRQETVTKQKHNLSDPLVWHLH